MAQIYTTAEILSSQELIVPKELVEFTGSIDTFFTTLKDAPSSSSSFIVHTDRFR